MNMKNPNDITHMDNVVRIIIFGPSSATRTHDLHIPNVARYQLRYTRKS